MKLWDGRHPVAELANRVLFCFGSTAREIVGGSLLWPRADKISGLEEAASRHRMMPLLRTCQCPLASQVALQNFREATGRERWRGLLAIIFAWP